jgi:hypothetical protein
VQVVRLRIVQIVRLRIKDNADCTSEDLK